MPPSYIRVCAVVWELYVARDRQRDTQTHRRPWPIYISPRLRLTRNATTLRAKKVHIFIFRITLCQKLTDFNAFSVLNPEKIWHQQLVHLPTSPVYCSQFTLGNPKTTFFNSIIHTYFRLFTLFQNKTNCYPLTHHTWKNVTTLPYQMQNVFIWDQHGYAIPIHEDIFLLLIS